MQLLEDGKIIELFFQRDQQAIVHTQNKFGRYLLKIAMNILTSRPDGEECVNDTYLRAWNAIPPQRPDALSTFLGRITRNLSIDRLRRQRAQKRSSQYARTDSDDEGNVVSMMGAGYDLSLDELSECIPSEQTEKGTPADEVGEALEAKELARTISDYLRTVTEEARKLFIYRYYDMESLKESAALLGITEAKAKTLLFRTRQGLKGYLEKEGWSL